MTDSLVLPAITAASTRPDLRTARTALTWGHRYLMVRPDHFRVAYAINPFMDPTAQPDPALALAQWCDLVAVLEALGATVDVVDQRSDAPDMCYAMNLGLVLSTQDRGRVTISHMRYAERRMESESARAWFDERAFDITEIADPEGLGGDWAHFEAGDAFPFAGRLLVGYGPRTTAQALARLAVLHDIAVEGLSLTHPAMYHLDLAFCPLDEMSALVCPAAFDEDSARALLSRVPDPIVLSEQEALTFCANSVVVGRDIVMPACPDRVAAELERRGMRVRLVDVSEFHKGGGSIRCLTNPLDIVVGRDLDLVPGGRLVMAAA